MATSSTAATTSSLPSLPSSTLTAPTFTTEQLQQCFNLFDLDHNTYITSAELHHIYKTLGENLTDSEVNEMLTMGSSGRGEVGVVEFSGFAEMMQRYTRGGASDSGTYITNQQQQQQQPPATSTDTLLRKRASQSSRAKKHSISRRQQSTAPNTERSHDATPAPASAPVSSSIEAIQQLQLSTDHIQRLAARYAQALRSHEFKQLDYNDVVQLLSPTPEANVQVFYSWFLQHQPTSFTSAMTSEERSLLGMLLAQTTADKAEQLTIAHQTYATDGKLSVDRLSAVLRLLQPEVGSVTLYDRNQKVVKALEAAVQDRAKQLKTKYDSAASVESVPGQLDDSSLATDRSSTTIAPTVDEITLEQLMDAISQQQWIQQDTAG